MLTTGSLEQKGMLSERVIERGRREGRVGEENGVFLLGMNHFKIGSWGKIIQRFLFVYIKH